MSASKDMGNAYSSYSDPLWVETYDKIKTKHDQAYLTIEEAIVLEEREKPNEAIEKYIEGIRLIDKALAVQVQCPDIPDFTWEKAIVMVQKMKKTKVEVQTRINSLQVHNSVPNAIPEDPPSYEEAVSSNEGTPITYRELLDSLNDLSTSTDQNMAEEVIYTHDDIRLYFISPNGEVLSSQQPETLKISLVEGAQPGTPKAILQVGAWVYPLFPGISPCYHTSYGAFILPDVYSNIPGSSVGIILPPDADKEVRDILEPILEGIIYETTAEGIDLDVTLQAKRAADITSKISNGIVTGAWYVSQGLVKGAQKFSDFIDSSTPKIINKIQPSDQPTQVPEKLSKGVQIAETATNKAAQVTGYVADKVGTATMRLGQFLAPHIEKQGTKLLKTGFNMSEQDASDKMKGVLLIAAGAFEGFSTVYRGLQTSAGILATNLKNNTVKIVEHKYGVPAAALTGDTFTTIGNVYTISQDAKFFKPKHLAMSTAKDAAAALTYSHTASCRGRASYQNLPGPSSQIERPGSPHSSLKNDKEEKK